MSIDRYAAAALRAVTVSDLTAYLTVRGWRSDPAESSFACTWYREDDSTGASDLIVPTREAVVDYPTRIAEILRVLERFEKRGQREILRDLQLSSCDIVRLRRPTSFPTDEVIVLHDGAALVQYAVTLMTAAACSAINPRAVVPSRRPAQAADYLRRVQMGQTERGSYVLTIVSTVAPLLTPGAPGLLEFIEEPFPRKVTRTLARSLTAIREASQAVERNGDFSAFTERVRDGISANLCDAIRGMVSRDDFEADIGVSIAWAVTSAPPRDQANAFEFSPAIAPLLADAAEHLRRSEPQEGAIVTGVVIGLHRAEGEWNGRISVACVLDGVVRQLQVELPGGEYQRALDAHGAQQGVMFRADVARVGRSYKATNVREFRVVP